jgi:hypothetical protein
MCFRLFPLHFHGFFIVSILLKQLKVVLLAVLLHPFYDIMDLYFGF